MSVKKILLLSAAGLAAIGATAAVAGGYTTEPSMSGNNYYVEGAVGYARQDYLDSVNWRRTSGFTRNDSHNNADGGFAGGVDVGYDFNQNYALELGWFYLPTVNTAAGNLSAINLKSWVLYLAGKYMAPLSFVQDTNWFFKLGAEYRDAKLDSAATTVGGIPNLGVKNTKSDFVRPMFATGLDYSFSNMLDGVFQYAYFMGADNSFHVTSSNTTFIGDNALETVSANVFTLGLAYKFTI